MYHFYQTPAFVLGADNVSEGSRMLSLFTRELGLVKVHARSIREEKSKLRSFLQPLSFSTVALIRGRDLWRLTTAGIGDGSIASELSWSHGRSLAHVARTLERHLQGEEGDSILYDIFRDGSHCLRKCDVKRLPVWESLMLARLLSRLGYGHAEAIDPRLAENGWDEMIITLGEEQKGKLDNLIERALLASQL